jgi:hypothetical protein
MKSQGGVGGCWTMDFSFSSPVSAIFVSFFKHSRRTEPSDYANRQT